MINIVLFEPEFPANVGNIIRLCANTNTNLHIIFPIPFPLDDKKLIRAGLDYHEFCNIKTYIDFQDFINKNPNARYFAVTTKSSIHYHTYQYQDNDFLIFGPETRGLPENIRKHAYANIRIPMVENSRSMNLANSVAICLSEALRQLNFPNLI